MNYFDKNKFLTAAVVLLLITNTGILGFLWLDRLGKEPGKELPRKESIPQADRNSRVGRMSPDGGPRKFIIQELKLDDKQIREYENLINEHQSEMRSIREKIRRNKDELWSIYSRSGNDTAAAEKIASEIGEDQKQAELITFRHFSKLRELCNEDQKKKFDEIINDVLKMMAPGNKSNTDQ